MFLSSELFSHDLNRRSTENIFERAIKHFFGVWGLFHREARRHELMFFISFYEPEQGQKEASDKLYKPV